MIAEVTDLPGVCLVRPELLEDARGFFARTFCSREFEEWGLVSRFVQCNVSYNRTRGTLRGLHFQAEPLSEAKLVWCTRGAIFDVVVDLRSGAPTFRRHATFELTESNRVMLYVPPGFAHGFQTLGDATEVSYQMSEFYAPELARGVRWDDPRLGIDWPLAAPLLSDRDQALPSIDDIRDFSGWSV